VDRSDLSFSCLLRALICGDPQRPTAPGFQPAYQLNVEFLLILGLKRRFQNLFESADLLLEFLDTLLSLSLLLSEVDDFGGRSF
jgi:hypothetical protein